ncbi:MAG: PQQ-binding-like beta-propeller repeat protein [Phycisphaerae bacterium]|nr:PQQ-binding-like beta-propeller repeat protein [Phycisphaerae bacterium]
MSGLAIALALAGSSAFAGDWATFRGDAAQAGVAKDALPEKLELLWQYEMGDALGMGLVVADGALFAAAQNGRIHALDAANGALKWKFEQEDAFVAPAAVIDGAVYVGDDFHMMFALDGASGKKRWGFETQGSIHSGVQAAGAGRVLFGSDDGHLYCLNAADGGVAWKYAADDRVYGTPAIFEGAALFSGCDGFLHVIRLSDGARAARIPIGSPSASSVAVDAASRRAVLGTHGNQVRAIELPGASEFAALLAKARVAAPSSAPASGPATASNVTSSGPSSESATAERAAAAERAFDPAEAGGMRSAWVFEASERQFPFVSSAAIDGGIVVIGGKDKVIWGLDLAEGKPRWRTPARGRIEASAVIAPVGEAKAPWAFVGAQDGTMYAVALADGRVAWQYESGASINTTAAIAGGRLYFANDAGTVFCFGVK